MPPPYKPRSSVATEGPQPLHLSPGPQGPSSLRAPDLPRRQGPGQPGRSLAGAPGAALAGWGLQQAVPPCTHSSEVLGGSCQHDWSWPLTDSRKASEKLSFRPSSHCGRHAQLRNLPNPFTHTPFKSRDPRLHPPFAQPPYLPAKLAHPNIPCAQQESLYQGQSLKNNAGLGPLNPLKLLMDQLGKFQHEVQTSVLQYGGTSGQGARLLDPLCSPVKSKYWPSYKGAGHTPPPHSPCPTVTQRCQFVAICPTWEFSAERTSD